MYSVWEADNGDGITVRDGSELVMKAYGTLSYSVLGEDFNAALAEMEKTFDNITYKKIARKGDWFVLSGYSGQNIRYIKCFFSAESAWLVDITYPKARKETYDPLFYRVSATFRVAEDARR